MILMPNSRCFLTPTCNCQTANIGGSRVFSSALANNTPSTFAKHTVSRSKSYHREPKDVNVPDTLYRALPATLHLIPDTLAALRGLAQGVIDQDERSHRLDHRDGAGEHAGIMTSARFQGGVLQIDVHGVLLVHHGGDGLERDAKINC